MKKFGMLFLCLAVIVLITGCNEVQEKEQKLICTTTENEDGLNVEQVISMTYSNDKLKHMVIEVNTTVTDSTAQENWEAFKEFMSEENKEFSKEGITLKVNLNDQTYEYDTILDIDIDAASEEALKEQGFEGLKEDTSTIEDSKQEEENSGATCRIEQY